MNITLTTFLTPAVAGLISLGIGHVPPQAAITLAPSTVQVETLAPIQPAELTGFEKDAMDLAIDMKFDEALLLVENDMARTGVTYEHLFMKARLLAWSGRHGEANTVLEGLATEYPNNVDVELVRGLLDYYQGNLSHSHRHFKSVLTIAPHYEDASAGVDRIQSAWAERMRLVVTKWRLDILAGLEQPKYKIRPEWSARAYLIKVGTRTEEAFAADNMDVSLVHKY